ncbi:hypothetical protein FGIG_09156 [Fasciola gigantica]|uniref:Uncharacterized protein n=1 Tax=Fasciola gigantica TaxID=46835 RepID=A0A504Y9N7_FASGI|nr:hypothetical protein FGIG_09156 [Fasciola gigantica]
MYSENGTESSLIDAQRNIENAFQLIESVSDSEDCCNNKLKSILSDADVNLKVSDYAAILFQKAAYEIAYKTSFGVENIRKLLEKENVLLLRRNNNIFGKAENSRKLPQTHHEQSDTVDFFPLSNVSPGEKASYLPILFNNCIHQSVQLFRRTVK